MGNEKENNGREEKSSSREIKGKLHEKQGDEILENMLKTPPKTHEEMKDK